MAGKKTNTKAVETADIQKIEAVETEDIQKVEKPLVYLAKQDVQWVVLFVKQES